MASMQQTVFGHFDHAVDARAAYAHLRRGQTLRPQVSIVVRTPGKAHEELPLSMTDARGGMLRGILISGVAGFLCTGLLVIVGSRLVGFSAAYAWLGALGGMFLGAFAGMLQGSAEPHPELLSMESEGGVLLAVTAPTEADRLWAEKVMRGHQARVEDRGAKTHARPSYAR